MSIIPYYINNNDFDVYFVANNPLSNTYHKGVVYAGSEMATGQPIVVFGDDEQNTLNLIYSHIADDDVIDDVDIPHEVQWSVGYNLSDATTVRDLVNSYDFVNINYLKHPSRDEYAIPFQNVIFDAMPDDANKTILANYASLSVSENRRRTTQDMVDNGWL